MGELNLQFRPEELAGQLPEGRRALDLPPSDRAGAYARFNIGLDIARAQAANISKFSRHGSLFQCLSASGNANVRFYSSQNDLIPLVGGLKLKFARDFAFNHFFIENAAQADKRLSIFISEGIEYEFPGGSPPLSGVTVTTGSIGTVALVLLALASRSANARSMLIQNTHATQTLFIADNLPHALVATDRATIIPPGAGQPIDFGPEAAIFGRGSGAATTFRISEYF